MKRGEWNSVENRMLNLRDFCFVEKYWNGIWCGFFCYGLCLAIRWVAFLQKAQNDRVTCKIPCHTEALAEVSTKSKRILNSLDFLLCGEVLKRNLVWIFVLWSVENGVLKMEIWRSVCKFKVWIFCFMKHEKRIAKTEFARIFCFVLTHSAQNDKVLVMLIKLSYWAFARKRSIHKFKVRVCTLKVYLKFFGFFAFCESSKWQRGVFTLC